ncbi:MAG: hypothetical protein IT436_00910 [Phycisphaerales bacterium]|nr:hypothetical protein [Phycisphaerales bacterium]
MFTITRASLLAALAGAAIPLTASAQTISWAAAVNGAWNDITKWNPQSVPDSAAETAVLGLTGPYSVNISGASSYAILGCQVANPQAVLMIDASIGITTAQLMLHSGALTNDGLIRLTANPATANNNRLGFALSGLTVSGTGEVRLEEAGDAQFYCAAGAGGTFAQAPGHTISGAGSISSGGATFINNGLVVGNRAGGLTLGSPVSNASVIRAIAPGAITLDNAMTQTGTGYFEADGATFTLASGAIISGGKGRSLNGGVVLVASGTATASDVTVEGEWQVPAYTSIATTTLQSTSTGLTNNGVIRLPANSLTANNNRLSMNGDGLTLSGTGEVRLEEAGDAELYCTAGAGGTFVHGADHTVSGAGSIASSGATLINNGLILGDLAGGLTLASPVSNNSVIRGVAPGAITLDNAMIQTASGSFEADGGTFTLASGSLVSGGVGRSLNGGVIVVASGTATASDVTVEGEWQVPAYTSITTTTLQSTSTGLINNGLIRLPANAATANNNYLSMNGNGLILSGTGEVRLEEAGDAYLYCTAGAGGSFAQGPGHTISGAGSIASSGATFINNGRVVGNLPGGLTLGSPVSNAAAVRAESPGSITLDNATVQTPSGYFEADGTRITLAAGSLVSGGVGRSLNGGFIIVGPGTATANELTAEGEWQVPAYTSITTTTLQSTSTGLTNNGLIRLTANAATANNNRLLMNGNGLVLSGTGEVSLEEADDTYLSCTAGAGGTFRQGPGHRISGLGTITSSGARFENEGTLAPGAPRGSLRIDCATTLKASGIVEIELSGDLDSQRDLLDATGRPITLGGTLNIHWHDGYVIPPCTSVVIIRGNLSGTFDVHDLPAMPDAELAVSYGTNTVTVTYIPGDLNGDGLLDFGDYLVFLNLYDSQDVRADLNQDGLVDFSDYLEFLNRYDAGC